MVRYNKENGMKLKTSLPHLQNVAPSEVIVFKSVPGALAKKLIPVHLTFRKLLFFYLMFQQLFSLSRVWCQANRGIRYLSILVMYRRIKSRWKNVENSTFKPFDTNAGIT